MNNQQQLIRPQSLKQFVGKTQVINAIKIALQAAKKLKKNFDHCLFYGPPGVGKTTLAHIIANEMGSKIKIIQGSTIKATNDLVSVLNGIKDCDVLFIDEIHNMNRNIVEMLYSVIEDNVIDILLGKIYNSKVIRLHLPQFTLIASTTYLGMIPKPLEDRFNYLFFIDSYSEQELKSILMRSLKIYDFTLNDQEINLIIQNARGIPRNVNRILRQIYNHHVLSKNTPVQAIIQQAGFIFQGLTEIDLKYLIYLNETPGQTASLKSITQGIGIDQQTVIEKIEPFLVSSQWINKSSRGRKLTPQGKLLIITNQLKNKLREYGQIK